MVSWHVRAILILSSIVLTYSTNRSTEDRYIHNFIVIILNLQFELVYIVIFDVVQVWGMRAQYQELCVIDDMVSKISDFLDLINFII